MGVFSIGDMEGLYICAVLRGVKLGFCYGLRGTVLVRNSQTGLM